MAITNAQQYQQLVNKPANGKRPGYRGDAAYGDRNEKGQVKDTVAAGDGPASKDFNQNAAPGGQDRSVYGVTGKQYDPETAKKAAIAQGKFKKKNPIQKTFDFLNKTYGKSLYNRFPNNPKNELAFLKNLSPSQRALLSPALKAKLEALDLDEDQDLLDTANTKFTFEEFQDLVNFQPTEGLNFADYAATYAGAPGLKYSGNVGGLEKYVIGKDEFGRTMYGYREERGGGRDDSILPIAQPVASIPEPTGYVNPLSLLTPRIAGTRFLGTEFEDDTESAADGGRIGAMGGGIMNTDVMGGLADGGMDESGRQMYFLGKLVKKAKRAVKKITKSKIGKAALIGALGYGLGGGTFFGKMLPGVTRGGQGFGGFGGLSSIFGNVGDMIGGSSLGDKFAKFGGSKLMKYAGLPAIIAGLTTPKDDDEFDVDAYYAANRLNLDAPLNRRILGTEFYAAEGGMPSKEPVAKKTMPLLDMDGQEMDLRAEGGFVPIGRMERADDVPARLSKNEFVFTADAVRNAGDGDVDKGAEVMYNMMKNLESGGDVSEESQGLEGAREMFQTSQRLEEVI